MPELPEVETIKRGLEKLLIGKTIARAQHDSPKSFPNTDTDVQHFLVHAKIIGIQRRAKVLLIALDTNYTLVIHLKMTGQLVYVGDMLFGAGHPTDSLLGALPDRSTRVTLTFTDGTHLYFNDQRKFGWVRLLPTPEVPNIDFMRKVGPEPLEADFTAEQFIARLSRRAKSQIKAALLDQTVIAGVGNIYADESLWAARIHPATRVHACTSEELVALYNAVRDVMNLSIAHGGSTDKNYVGADGERGSYLTFANVFRREGKACPRCGSPITKTRVAGRGTHTCMQCQSLRDTISA